jgi:hypothetical protein
MEDLSDIGRRALRVRAGAYAIAAQCFHAGRGGAEIIFGPGGRRKSLKRLKTDKEIQGKPSRFLGSILLRLGSIWLDLAKFGTSLDYAARRNEQTEASMHPH